jgi:hypothetical protein
MVLAVYSSGSAFGAPEDRRTGLLGLVFSPVRFDKMTAGLFGASDLR